MKAENLKKRLAAVRKKAESGYKKIGSVVCPYLKEEVHFNYKGLDHIRNKDWKRSRDPQDQLIRYKYLHLAPRIVAKSNTVQGYGSKSALERVKINGRREQRMIVSTRFEFVAVLDDDVDVGQKVRFKIIVKKIGDKGKPYFWSIIPFWKTKDGSRLMDSGNTETD